MQRLCSKLRSLPLFTQKFTTCSPGLLRNFNYSSNLQPHFSSFSTFSHCFNPHFNGPTSSLMGPRSGSHLPRNFNHSSFVQTRSFSAKSKEKKWKKLTPATSRVKKIKMKGYSSYKGRFKTLNDGTIRRWREGKRHNAHLKSKKAKRRLRQPELVHAAYAKVMKKLNFCSNY